MCRKATGGQERVARARRARAERARYRAHVTHARDSVRAAPAGLDAPATLVPRDTAVRISLSIHYTTQNIYI